VSRQTRPVTSQSFLTTFSINHNPSPTHTQPPLFPLLSKTQRLFYSTKIYPTLSFPFSPNSTNDLLKIQLRQLSQRPSIHEQDNHSTKNQSRTIPAHLVTTSHHSNTLVCLE
jgi:hypothetical protein